jgi:hypothetical protein
MEDEPQDRLDLLRGKLAERGLSDDEVRELGDLERGGPPPLESKIRPWTPPVRPWHLAWWRGRSLGVVGGLLVVVLILVAVVIAFRRGPAVAWRVYPDTKSGFRIDYPDGWVPQPIDERSPTSGLGRLAQHVAGVVMSRSGREPADVETLLGGPVTEPFYGLIVRTPVPSPARGVSVVQACRRVGFGGLHQPARQVTLGGLAGAQFDSTVRGIIRRDVCAFRGRTLVTFFARVPVGQDAATRDVIDGAQRSVGF